MLALRTFVIEVEAGRQQDATGLDPETQAPFLGILRQEVAGVRDDAAARSSPRRRVGPGTGNRPSGCAAAAAHGARTDAITTDQLFCSEACWDNRQKQIAATNRLG